MSSTESLRERIDSFVKDFVIENRQDDFMRLIEQYGLEQRIDALKWALNDYNMPDTDTRKNLEEYISELQATKPEKGTEE